MSKMFQMICVLALMALTVQFAQAATTYHVFAGADNVSPNFSTLTAAITAVRAGTGGDTIQFDDSTTYTMTAQPSGINKANTSIIAAPGCNPVIQLTALGSFVFNFSTAGGRVGSIDGGRITFDGANVANRCIYFDTSTTTFDIVNPSTNTVENCVFKRYAVGPGNTTANGCYLVIVGNATTARVLADGTKFNLRYLDLQFPSGSPSIYPSLTQGFEAFRLSLTGNAVCNIENVQSNTLVGYVVAGGFEGANSTFASGTINLKNCRFIYNDPTMIADPRMGSPVALMNMNTGAAAAGFTLNVDNCYIRSDASKSGWVNTTNFTRTEGTSNSLGAISLMNYSKNALNVTNSAIVGCGSGINIDSAHSALSLTASDIYVPTAAMETTGNFINLSPRTVAATSADHQCVATRCNFYGLTGSEIRASNRGAGSVFSMVQCNDWSPVNAYASNWVTSNCQQPGQNPGYGNNADPSGAIAGRDFTVYNNTIKAQNIGANRDFNFGVPVELSAFSVL